ncbi:hypothetical protein SAMN05446635_6056 [Burkholderia sp. OK233]|nr:hypothetical protein SAMN05446635_6056 [Burkholderia sp. OK233]
MDQTKLTAHLPTVDVEITRHALPEQNAEAITIHVTATPSFDAAARWLVHASLFPIAPPFSDRAPVFTVGRPHARLAAVVAGQFRVAPIAARTGIATAGEQRSRVAGPRCGLSCAPPTHKRAAAR